MRNESVKFRSRRPDTHALVGRPRTPRSLPALASLALPGLLLLSVLLVTQGCASTWVDQQGHGDTTRKALQAQRISPGAISPGSAAQGPTQPAATELRGALQNHLRAPASNAGQVLTPVLPESGR